VNWTDYYTKIERLAVQVYQSGWQFNQIVCLARGGLRIGDVLSRLYRLPLAILATSSYRDPHDPVRETLIFSRDLTMTTANLGSHVLLVDDLVDSGLTLGRTVMWLDRHYGFYIQEVRTAVLWYKSVSQFKPDYYVDFLADSPWIHQPFEPYERMGVEQLVKRWPPADDQRLRGDEG
jgi:hypoxanthine phosphoribosyltransferase